MKGSLSFLFAYFILCVLFLLYTLFTYLSHLSGGQFVFYPQIVIATPTFIVFAACSRLTIIITALC